MATNAEFLSTIKEGCIQGWRSHAILPSISGAQAILESNWSKSTLATKANNLFGIKGEYNGASFSVETKEFINGTTKYVTAAFRKYPSWAESIADHSAFFTSTDWRKEKYAAVVGETDYTKAAQALSTAGYATDPDYPAKLIKLIEAYDLAAWDLQEEETKMEYIYESLLNAGTMNGIYGAVIHNDYGKMTPKQYAAWLKTRNLELGIAHYYGNRSQMARVIDTNKIGWHTASSEGNGHYIGYEVCESLSASDADFLANEDAVCKQVAEDFAYYGITPDRNTVRLHKEFTSTSCPHRSWDLHGQSINAVKDYFISRIKSYMAAPAVTTTVVEVVSTAPVRNPVSYNAVIKSGGYSIDSKPWGEDGAENWGNTDTIIGNSIYIYEENYSGEYANAYQVGWIDKRAFEKEKVVVASILFLPNGQNWTIYPADGPYSAGDIISTEAPKADAGLSLTVLGDRGNNIVIVDMPNFGTVGIYFDADKGATITQVLG